MACLASTYREFARISARSIQSNGSARGFRSCSKALAAQNMSMPSLSPTMTEGGISRWAIKEGDSFSAGDVLLEVETDKAQMDVEAQDDGILAKIMIPEGSKAIQVGSRIAVLAEPGDDLSTLAIPSEPSSAPAPAPKSSTPSKSPSPPSSSLVSSQADAGPAPPSSSPPKKQKYPLYPSVAMLLHEKGLVDVDPATIPASGPNGRLLKGDVLAFAGRIQASYPSSLSATLLKRGQLDLSNIVIAPPPKVEAKPNVNDKEAAAAIPPPPKELTLPISLSSVRAVQSRIQSTLGIAIPFETFLVRATLLANEDLPRDPGTALTQDELFDAVLGLDKVRGGRATQTGGFVPQILGESGARSAGSKAGEKLDVLDLLTGATPRKARGMGSAKVVEGGEGEAVFRVEVPMGKERSAKVFLERVKGVLEGEPGRLVVGC